MQRYLFYPTIVILISALPTETRHISSPQANARNVVFDEMNANHWYQDGQINLQSKLQSVPNTKIAKNVILFIGDGMSIPTLAATRSYLGHKYNIVGEDIKLSFEEFPYTGLSKTYCVDSNVADSACSGTAYLTGVKANAGTVGLSAGVTRGDCYGQRDGAHTVYGMMAWAQAAKKATGIVTTTRVTHATPAASYAHSADRKWECDADLPRTGPQCDDIAVQLVRGHIGSKINVILGGGRKKFYPKTAKDTEGHRGSRSDGVDLRREWLITKESKGAAPAYVYNRAGLLKINPTKYDSLLGLFAPEHMPYNMDAIRDQHPSLSEMTQKAIEILSGNKKGYFLFVEGGRIDTAHHENKAQKALDETAELAKAVEAALKMVNLEETLIVVTSDHSHTMSYSGYSTRGNDILGFSSNLNGTDKLPFTTLSYANGPGYRPEISNQRFNLEYDDIHNPNFAYPALVPLLRETHGGDDVAVFAIGPWSHLFTGNYEQNFIPHGMAFASCIGPGYTACRN